ncbi:hypothetical protein M9H77_06030 [Catharanthus roseus]|uniref:Uncharacterized protein n=1 Tax=Catharanthus roseus TaxID=4058 RepID=A0ACC0BQX7_CATRO|nr:hypothetical protein M9H77_06030 [Catharanthus roseus]
MDDHSHMPGMSPPTQMNNNSNDHHTMMMMMPHMTFSWSKNAEILFSGWPGTRTGMYVLALIFVFILSLLVEFLSDDAAGCKWIVKNKDDGSISSLRAVLETIRHGLKTTLAYLIMLAVMSFNVGVLIVAVAGHVFGFLIFRSCRKSSANLSPGSC